MSGTLTVVARATTIPEGAPELRRQLLGMLRESDSSEPSLISWSLAQSTSDANTLVVIEVFADRAAYDYHEARTPVLAVSQAISELVIAGDVHVYATLDASEADRH